MQIDPKSHLPIYRQIAQQLCNKITQGVYLTGEKISSLRSLSLEIHVNPNTIQGVYEELEHEGVVLAQRGVGMVVADRDAFKAKGKTAG